MANFTVYERQQWFNRYPEVLHRARYWTAHGTLLMDDNCTYLHHAYCNTRAQDHTFRRGQQNRVGRSLVADGELDRGRLEVSVPRDWAVADLHYAHRLLTERMAVTHAFLPLPQ